MTTYPTTVTMPDMMARLAELPRPGAIEIRDDTDLPERPDP